MTDCDPVRRRYATHKGWRYTSKAEAILTISPDTSCIGLDIGGTTARAARVNRDGRIVDACRASTPRDWDGLRRWIASSVAALSANSTESVRVGIALPGVLDEARTRVVRSVNLPFLEGRDLRKELRSDLGVEPILVTDADAVTWGEYVGCDPHPSSFVHLRLGTGVACGMIVDGALRRTGGPRTTHWEALVVADGPPCPCGLRGCLEAIASGPAIERRASAFGISGGLNGLQRAFVRENPAALDVVTRTARALVTAMENLSSQVPEGFTICIGGGVLTGLPCLLKALTAEWIARGGASRAVTIQLASLGDNAGLIGAALLAKRKTLGLATPLESPGSG